MIVLFIVIIPGISKPSVPGNATSKVDTRVGGMRSGLVSRPSNMRVQNGNGEAWVSGLNRCVRIHALDHQHVDAGAAGSKPATSPL